MSHKLCNCNKSNQRRAYIYTQRKRLRGTNSEANTHESKTETFDPLLSLVDGVEDINNFFKMRHIPIGKILFWIGIIIITALTVIFAPIGVQ